MTIQLTTGVVKTTNLLLQGRTLNVFGFFISASYFPSFCNPQYVVNISNSEHNINIKGKISILILYQLMCSPGRSLQNHH